MKLAIENKNLVRVINFLDGLSLKGMKSIHRTNLSFLLAKKVDQVGKNEKQLREDGKGEPEKLKEWLVELFDEKTVIDSGDSIAMLTSVKATIKELTADDSEHEFKNEEAYAVACLYNAFNLGGEE